MHSPELIKKDFPIFQHHPKLVYLDSAATSLKPRAVIEAERVYYEQYGVNIHRGVYGLSVRATEAYEGAREKIRQFINASSAKEIVFVRGSTEAINLVAQTFGRRLGQGDVILLSDMEHHANIVPWQQLAEERRVTLRWIPVTATGALDTESLNGMLTPDVKLVAINHMSNVLGTVNDVKTIIAAARRNGSFVLVDGAQSAAHLPVDVRDLDADFFVFSGHKMLGPTGIGVLYAKEQILCDLPPYQRGGDMILEVSRERAAWNELPWKFEAGTPNIAGAIGLGAAVDYLRNIGMRNIWAHEQELNVYGLEKLMSIPGLRVLGSEVKERGAVFSCTLEGIHPHDIGTILDEQEIAVRAGHHCAMPLHATLGLPASVRASGYLYTTKEDIDALVQGLRAVQEKFR